MNFPHLKKPLACLAVSVALFTTLTAYAVKSFADAYPKPATFVNDYAGVLSKETKTELENLTLRVAQNNGPQIAVAIIRSLGDTDIDTARNELFKAWGVGVKEKDNGVLVLIAITERKIGIETGYGVEGDLPDLETARLRETYAAPAFRAGDYNQGVSLLVNALAKKLTGGELPPAPPTPARGHSWLNANNIFYIVILLTMLLRSAYYKMAGSRSIWFGGIAGFITGIFGAALAPAFGLLIVIAATLFGFGFDFLVSHVLPPPKPRDKNNKNNFWFFGGGGSGGIFGGGHGGSRGGFGGGGSGGGGSSDSW